MLTKTEKISFIRSVFGPVQKTTGENIQVVCPFCNKRSIDDGEGEIKKQKLAIDLANSERWHCWVCGERGGNLKNIIGVFFKEKLDFYIANFKPKNSKIKEEEEVGEADENVELPEDFMTIYEGLKYGGFYKRCMEYLVGERGLTPRQVIRWGFGVSRQDNWMGRIIMPSFDSQGKLNYLTGRDISGKKLYKYWNSKRSKNNLIVNEISLDFKREINLVEGPFDLVHAPENTTCLLGSSIHPKKSRLFSEIVKNNTPIVIALDENMIDTKIPKIVKSFKNYDIDVSVIDYRFLDDEDIGASSKKSIKEAFENKIKWSAENIAERKLNSFWKRKIF